MAAIGTRKLKLEIDGVDKSPETTNARFNATDAEGDSLTWGEAAEGGKKDWSLLGTAHQDGAAGSIWSEIWDNAGQEVPIVLMPYGNAAPSLTEPHWEATAIIGQPDGDVLGGEPNLSATAKLTFDFAWKLTGKPVKVTA